MKSVVTMRTQSQLARSGSLSGRGGHLKTRFCTKGKGCYNCWKCAVERVAGDLQKGKNCAGS